MTTLQRALLTLLSATLSLTVAGSSAASTIELRLSADLTLCLHGPANALEAAGIPRVTLFIEGEREATRLCFEAAIAVAATAVLRTTRTRVPREQLEREKCDARCWFDRETAALAGPVLNGTIWPPPPASVKDGWLFFAASPDLSTHWTWVWVGDDVADDGTVPVLVWSER